MKLDGNSFRRTCMPIHTHSDHAYSISMNSSYECLRANDYHVEALHRSLQKKINYFQKIILHQRDVLLFYSISFGGKSRQKSVLNLQNEPSARSHERKPFDSEIFAQSILLYNVKGSEKYDHGFESLPVCHTILMLPSTIPKSSRKSSA